jgi:F0F1-type ATP synthase membrane subunit c/vacuolar-type H+-ATPase subunit K
MALVTVAAWPAAAWAADGVADWPKAFAVLAAGSAVDAMARQPGAIARIQTAMLLGLAFIESLTLFVFVVAVILLFVKS